MSHGGARDARVGDIPNNAQERRGEAVLAIQRDAGVITLGTEQPPIDRVFQIALHDSIRSQPNVMQ